MSAGTRRGRAARTGAGAVLGIGLVLGAAACGGAAPQPGAAPPAAATSAAPATPDPAVRPYCDTVTRVQGEQAAPGAGQGGVPTSSAAARQQVADLVAVAPPEIADDWRTVQSLTDQALASLAEHRRRPVPHRPRDPRAPPARGPARGDPHPGGHPAALRHHLPPAGLRQRRRSEGHPRCVPQRGVPRSTCGERGGSSEGHPAASHATEASLAPDSEPRRHWPPRRRDLRSRP